MLNSDCAYLDELRVKYADLIAKNKNKRVKDIELNNMIDKIKQEPSEEDEEEEVEIKYEQPQYKPPRTFGEVIRDQN